MHHFFTMASSSPEKKKQKEEPSASFFDDFIRVKENPSYKPPIKPTVHVSASPAETGTIPKEKNERREIKYHPVTKKSRQPYKKSEVENEEKYFGIKLIQEFNELQLPSRRDVLGRILYLKKSKYGPKANQLIYSELQLLYQKVPAKMMGQKHVYKHIDALFLEYSGVCKNPNTQPANVSFIETLDFLFNMLSPSALDEIQNDDSRSLNKKRTDTHFLKVIFFKYIFL